MRQPSRGTRARPQTARLYVRVSGCAARLAARIRRTCRAVMAAERLARGQLDVTVVDDAAMRRLHRQWLGRSRSTDVVTFDLRERPRKGEVDGHVIVCRDAARREARRRRTDWRAELLLYVSHGCLHLAGYDDRDRHGFQRMHRREDVLLTRLGYGPVFRPSAARRASGGAR